MTAGATAVSIVNQALQEIAGQAQITALNDGTAAGNAAGILYTPAVRTLLRQQDYEFARADVALTPLASTVALPYEWSNGYVYPADCLRVRSVKPATWNLNDPQPVRWTVQEWPIGTLAIMCNVPAAVLTYTTATVTEAQFDSVFQETLVRLLASELVMAIGGRPDFSAKTLEQAGALVGQGAGRDS